MRNCLSQDKGVFVIRNNLWLEKAVSSKKRWVDETYYIDSQQTIQEYAQFPYNPQWMNLGLNSQLKMSNLGISLVVDELVAAKSEFWINWFKTVEVRLLST